MVLAGRVAPALELGTRCQQLKCSEIAVENRDALNLLVRENSRHVGSIGLQLRNFPCNFYRLSYRTHLQRRIRTDRSVGVHANTRNVVGLESGGLDSDFVTVRDQMRDRVVSALVRGRFFRRAFSAVS